MRKDTAFRLLTPPEVVERWEALRALLEPAVAQCRGECEVDDLRRLVIQCRMFIFVLERGAALSAVVAVEFATYPQQVVMLVAYAGGRGLAAHAPLVAASLRAFAAKAGAARICAWVGSPAHQRFFARFFGATPAYTVMEFSC